jgi:hypothetical protein
MSLLGKDKNARGLLKLTEPVGCDLLRLCDERIEFRNQ